MRHINKLSVPVLLTFSSVDSPIHISPSGIPYLREPGIVLIGQTASELGLLENFLKGFSKGFEDYLGDTFLDPGSQLSKFAGQVCYLSLGEKRTRNINAKDYFINIKAQSHGSVLEHPVYTFLFYGIDRAVTHELVRHRAGKAFSQVSQRYIGPEMLRYVMPAELQGDPDGEEIFFNDIKTNKNKYERRIDYLMRKNVDLEGESKTDKRKRLQSFARRALANEVEAPIVMSGNVRSWRHVFTKRCAPSADRAIRAPMFEALRILQETNETGFDDFSVRLLADETYAAEPKYIGV